jgi:D-glycero-D-manno-heptose 1,7-bisphosphate phosphatase
MTPEDTASHVTARATGIGPAIFLDRDGVLNEEVNYLHDPKDLVMVPRAAEAVARFNAAKIPVYVVTNQAGIGRGYYGLEDYRAVNAKMSALLAAEGAHIDDWYLCPHAPTADCPCRKPRPGMLQLAAREHALDLPRSVLVGDKDSDLEAGRAAGCQTILVRTGYGRQTEIALAQSARSGLFDGCFGSLVDAVETIVSRVRP